MRIAFYVPRAEYLEACPGGAFHISGSGMFISNMLTGLRERAHKVKIVSRLDVRDFWRGRLPARLLVAEAALVRGDMKRFSPDAWIVYASSVQYPDLFGWWQSPKRYLLLGCEGPVERKVEQLPRPWRGTFGLAHRRSLQRADDIVVVRPKIAPRLCADGVPEDRIHILPLAIKPWKWMPCRQEARRALGLPQEAPVILCVRRFSLPQDNNDPRPAKAEAIIDLIAAFAALPSNAVLLLVGDGRGRPQAERMVAELGLEGRIRFAGEVEHEDVKWFYAACDFFAFPDIESNRPYQAFLEAQACGRPVLALQTSTAELTVKPGRTGLLAKDLEEFQALLLALAKDRSRCEELGRAGPAHVARSFSIETRVGQIEELLLGRSAPMDAGIQDSRAMEGRKSGRKEEAAQVAHVG